MTAAAKKRTDWPGSKPTGKKRTFIVTVTKTTEIAIDEAVLAQGVLPDNPIFGARVTEDDVVKHIAFNLLCNDIRLSQIDGYANCPDDSVRVEAASNDWDVEIEEPRSR